MMIAIVLFKILMIEGGWVGVRAPASGDRPLPQELHYLLFSN